MFPSFFTDKGRMNSQLKSYLFGSVERITKEMFSYLQCTYTQSKHVILIFRSRNYLSLAASRAFKRTLEIINTRSFM